MARPTQNEIQTFMRITGSSEWLALRKLEEYGGNLEQAVNAHFRETETHVTNPISNIPPDYDSVDTSHQMQVGQRGFLPLLSAARSFRPSLLLDPHYRRNILNHIGASVFPSREPQFSHAGAFNSGYGQPYYPGPSPVIGNLTSSYGPQIHGNVQRDEESHPYGNNIEEEMIQQAIEASKEDTKEDDEFARAVSLSLMTAEQEKAMRERSEGQKPPVRIHDSSGRAEKTINGRWKPGSSSLQEGTKDVEEQLLWAAISSKELDEAILLEAAHFGEIPEGTSPQHVPHLQSAPDRSKGLNSQHIPCSPSSSIVSQRLLREQQDDEYRASLVFDREREMNALRGRETRLKKEESQTKILEGEKFERLLAAKEASLPKEPAVNDENAVTLLVRMPDGSRRGRRFLKSDKLRFLFDFIDVGRAVKPGTYSLVRPYPRRAFYVGDISLSLNEVGLTNKQEALFLELI